MNNMEFLMQLRMEPPQPSPLANDIIFSILMRLPIKSLLKFRCVSKNWNSIISSPSFILNYSFPRPQSYFYLHFLESVPKRKSYAMLCDISSFSVVSMLDIPSTVPSFSDTSVVLGSCRGLLCLTDQIYFGCELYLWNPSIRKNKVLRTSSIFTETFNFRDPRILTIVGLGYDSRTNDYKVLRLVLFDSERSRGKSRRKPIAEIYSLSLDSWRRVGLPDHLMENLIAMQARSYAYVDEAIHWLADFLDEKGEIYSSILRFDVSEERFREVEMPNDCLNGILHRIEEPTVYKGLLALLIYGYEPANEGGEYVYYLCTLNKGIWTKYRVEFEGMGCCCECIGDHLLVDKMSDGKLYLFDPQSSKRKALEVENPRPESIHAFTESLALL